jgi:hypothetical protein
MDRALAWQRCGADLSVQKRTWAVILLVVLGGGIFGGVYWLFK